MCICKENDAVIREELYIKEAKKRSLETHDKIYQSEITSIVELTKDEKLFHITITDPDDREKFVFEAGQFCMLEVPGIGEIPVSISSSPSVHGSIELCIRKAGSVTNFLHRVPRGTKVGLRGPFGTAFPMEKMHGKNILLIAGGLGIAPLRAPVFYVQENRSMFKDVNLLYGTKDPSQLLFTHQYETWKNSDDIKMDVIVEKPDDKWDGSVGMITELLKEDEIDGDNTYAIVCGPPVMFKFVCNKLTKAGIPMQRMFVSLERRMHCGMGKCCRCNVGHTYTCIDGPVFDYWTVMNLKEAI
jgi:sulfhydrogenase subunit gamma (sulfur reductase)